MFSLLLRFRHIKQKPSAQELKLRDACSQINISRSIINRRGANYDTD